MLGVALGLLVWCAGCKDLSGHPTLPAGLPDPTTLNNPAGASLLARGAVSGLRDALSQSVYVSGAFTDETTGITGTTVDSRNPNTTIDVIAAYSALQVARNNAALARAVMQKYAPDSSRTLAELYATEGYTEVLLAELYCSGIPLSTVDFQQDFTYHAGSTSAEVYATAAALFDTASSLARDSIATLARVGWGRALLELGQFDSAAHVVASVPTSSEYRMRVALGSQGVPLAVLASRYNGTNGGVSMSDAEGHNGLPFVSANDPRAWPVKGVLFIGSSTYSYYYPVQYAAAGQGDTATMVVSSGVEARLIEAEADLRRNGTQWLTILNTLRTDGSYSVQTRTGVPGVSPAPAGYPDTTWNPGTGSYVIPPEVMADASPQCDQGDGITPPPCTDTVWYRGLAPLADPGATLSGQAATDARVDLLFRERAFWLYLTAHREGDFRRLIRLYGRSPSQVYPTGGYSHGVSYGTAIVLPIPDSEEQNPQFAGCLPGA